MATLSVPPELDELTYLVVAAAAVVVVDFPEVAKRHLLPLLECVCNPGRVIIYF